MKISGKLIIIVIIVVIIGLIFAVKYKYISLEVVAIITGPLAAIFTVSLFSISFSIKSPNNMRITT